MVKLHLEVVNLYFIRTWESEPINLIPISKYKKCEKSPKRFFYSINS